MVSQHAEAGVSVDAPKAPGMDDERVSARQGLSTVVLKPFLSLAALQALSRMPARRRAAASFLRTLVLSDAC
jgi:hypothetical protein